MLITKPTYSDPAYSVRLSQQLGAIAGNVATAKWITYANSFLYDLQVNIDTLGTSTFTSTSPWGNGVGTKSAQTIQLTIVQNTNTTGTAVTLTTTTFGPYTPGGPGTGTTGLTGGYNTYVINTSTGTGGFGGYYVPAGAEIIATLGTDATAILVAAVTYQLAPLAGITA